MDHIFHWKPTNNLLTRASLIIAYIALVLLSCKSVFLAFGHGLSAVIIHILVSLNALPLLLIKFYQDFLYGGPNGKGINYFLVITAVEFSPLLLLSIFPGLWNRSLVRRGLVMYGAVLVILTVGGAAWLYLEPSLLAS